MLDSPGQTNRSEFNGSGGGRTNVLAGGSRWSAKITMPDQLSERAFRPWRSFLARARGRANAFRVVAVEGPQIPVRCNVVVDGADQKGYSLATRGWYQGAQMLDGMFLTVGDRLLVVAGDTMIAGADGKLTIAVEPLVPGKLVDGAAVEVNLPYAVLQMSDTRAGYTVGVGQMYSVSFQAEEQ
jgi:hypothetical protein